MKIIGSGFLASAFLEKSYSNNFILFASGVSNSQEIRVEEFEREITLLKQELSSSLSLVYLSTCSLEDPSLSEVPYFKHKRHAEELVLEGKKNIVVRLPQVVGFSKNKKTLTNFPAWKIYLKQRFILYKGAFRNLVDIEDVKDLVELALPHSEKLSLISLALPHSTEVSIIVKLLEETIGHSGLYEEKEVSPPYKYKESKFLQEMLGIENKFYSKEYFRNTILKYYEKFPESFI